jgi:hypothetical protein
MSPPCDATADEVRPATVIEFRTKTARAPCAVNPCPARAILVIESLPLCLEHFISHCYWKLSECEQHAFEPSRAASANDFLENCRLLAVTVLIAETKLPNIDRARLLDIVLWASELILPKRRGEKHPTIELSAGLRAARRR